MNIELTEEEIALIETALTMTVLVSGRQQSAGKSDSTDNYVTTNMKKLLERWENL